MASLAALLAAGLFALLLGATAFGAAPLHGRLQHRFDATLHRRLLHWDSARAVIAVGQMVLVSPWC